jgi:hypothetical protein
VQDDTLHPGGGDEIVLSPRGDRLVLQRGGGRLVDTETLALISHFDGFFALSDAVFFPQGDSLLVLGQSADPPPGERVAIVSPDDGRLIADVTLAGPDGTTNDPVGVGLDPAGWIYVAGDIASDTLFLPVLMVVDRESLEVVAILRTTPDQRYGRFNAGFDGLAIVPAPAYGKVFVVWENRRLEPPSRPTGVYVFDRVP